MGIYRVLEDCAILAFIIQPWFTILSLFYTSQGSSLPDHDPFSGWPHVCGKIGSRQNPVQNKVLSSPEWMNERSVGIWRFVTENTWGDQWLSVSQGTEQKLHCQRMFRLHLSPLLRLFSPGSLSANYHDKVPFLYKALLLFWKPNPHKYWNKTWICISPLSMVIESPLCAITENKNNICGCQTLPAQEVISEQIIFCDSTPKVALLLYKLILSLFIETRKRQLWWAVTRGANIWGANSKRQCVKLEVGLAHRYNKTRSPSWDLLAINLKIKELGQIWGYQDFSKSFCNQKAGWFSGDTLPLPVANTVSGRRYHDPTLSYQASCILGSAFFSLGTLAS